MKTVLQELKDRIENKIISSAKENGDLSEYQYSHNIAYNTVLTIIELLLEKEKEQSIELIKQTAMFMAASNLDEEIAKMNYEEVYNSYYNQK